MCVVRQLMCGSDIVRAKLLHWHKAVLFPDFMPPRGGDDEETDDIEEDDSEEELGEPSTARRVAYVASTALALVAACGLGAVLLAPLETVCTRCLSLHKRAGTTHTLCHITMSQITIRMAAQPHVYGPLGTLGVRLSCCVCVCLACVLNRGADARVA
jgi:hypothetical protein